MTMTMFSIFKCLLIMASVVIGLPALNGCNDEQVLMGKAVATLNQKAQTLLTAGDAPGAVARLQAANDLNPTQPDTLRNLAIAYQANDQFDQAVEIYKQLIPLQPKEKAAYLQSIGVAYEAQGDKIKAQLLQDPTTVAQECSTKVKSPFLLKPQAKAAYQEAQASYRAAAEVNPEQVDALKKQAEDLQQAIDSLDKVG
jgi:tetratricopeptide (TPR) repeat protein